MMSLWPPGVGWAPIWPKVPSCRFGTRSSGGEGAHLSSAPVMVRMLAMTMMTLMSVMTIMVGGVTLSALGEVGRRSQTQ